MTERIDIAVVGAGVVGLGVGWELARRGRDVTVFERGRAGRGASTAAAGMLAPTAELEFEEEQLLELEMASLERYPGFVERLERTTGRDLDYRTDGTLVVALERDHAEALDHIHAHHRQLGLDAEQVDTERLREMEPGLAPSVHSGVYCRSDYQVDPKRLVAALADGLHEAGGELFEETPVARLDVGEAVEGLVTETGTTYETDRIVLAAGARTDEIDGVPDDVLPHIRPVRGQMLSVDLGEPPLCRHVLRVPDPSRQNVYLAPKSDGRLLIGATSEERGFDPNLTAGGVFELLRGAYRALPGIYDHDLLDAWTGFRPVTLDNEPVLGPTDVDGLWLALGHGRSGILLAAVTAEALAASIDEGQIDPVLSSFTPASDSR